MILVKVPSEKPYINSSHYFAQLYIPVGIISSGVDRSGDVDVETPPKPFIMLFVRFKETVDVERTSMFPPFAVIVGFPSTTEKS